MATAAPATDMSGSVDRETALGIWRTMTRIAAADRAICQALAAGDLQFQCYPAGGQEAIPAAIASVLEPDDLSVITYRCIHDIVAKGTPMTDIMAEMYGRVTGTSKGKGGPMHLTDPNSGLMATTGIVGAGAPIANGIALAQQLRGTGRIVTCSFGDGAANIGAVHEALNLAALWKLPVVFVCQNNLHAEYTSYADSTASPSIAGRAEGYGMAGERVDGTDPVAVREAAARAVARARAGEGPTLLECVAHRLRGMPSAPTWRTWTRRRSRARAAAPIITYRARLLAEGLASEEELAAIEAEAEAAETRAFAETSQTPSAAELTTDIFESGADLPDGPPRARPPSSLPPPGDRMLTFGQAITEALDIALGSDPAVTLLGEDIEDPAGGIVKATYGLSTRHGRNRVRGTPISEQAIVGAGIGAAMGGLKPVAEIMVCDVAMVAMDQIANHAAKLRYMSGGRTAVPMTMRMLTAGNVGSFGAQHSQSLEAWFCHIPGLKVVAPSTAHDAKGLLLSAIHDPDPVIFIEAMRCFFVPGPVPEGDYRVPLGLASVARPGRDLTILSWSWGMQEALAAAADLAGEGVAAEVIDLRSLVPLDTETIARSVGQTGRVLIGHPAVEFCGFGAELAARLQERFRGEPKAPVALARLGAACTPIPFAQNLESLHFPNAEGVKAKARALMGMR